MKVFHFRLERALRLRRAQMQAAEAKLKDLLGEELRIRESLATIAEERLEACCYVQREKTTNPIEMRALSAYLTGLQARAAKLQKILASKLEIIRDQRREILHLERNESLLSKLRDKKFADWQNETDREIETIAQEAWLASRGKQKILDEA